LSSKNLRLLVSGVTDLDGKTNFSDTLPDNVTTAGDALNRGPDLRKHTVTGLGGRH